ncbi:MAG TPA: DUF4440 domain-containing protein [Pirellulaceae bacterium]|nr:DUF4440 domain-containing protein [Pirellulaceae bacterium]
MNTYDYTFPRWLLFVLLSGLAGMVFNGGWIFNSGPDPNPSRHAKSSSPSLMSSGSGSSVNQSDWRMPADQEMTTEISVLLQQQVDAWNRGDLLEFMQTYWESELLTFSSGGRTQRGWHATFERYRARYPKGSMGKLRFDELEIYRLTDQWALVLGRWFLTSETGDSEGNFTLVLREVGEAWVIVHDHSSLLADDPPDTQPGKAGD